MSFFVGLDSLVGFFLLAQCRITTCRAHVIYIQSAPFMAALHVVVSLQQAFASTPGWKREVHRVPEGFRAQDSESRVKGSERNVEALAIRTGFWGPLYYDYSAARFSLPAMYGLRASDCRIFWRGLFLVMQLPVVLGVGDAA